MSQIVNLDWEEVLGVCDSSTAPHSVQHPVSGQTKTAFTIYNI